MRWTIAICLSASFTATIAVAADDPSAQWWGTLSAPVRVELQSDLMLLDLYDGLADGQFGPITESALQRFQSEVRVGPPSGVLADDELDKLRTEGNSMFADLGMQLVQDHDDEVAAYVPLGILTNESHPPGGGLLYSTPDLAFQLYLTGEIDDGGVLDQADSSLTQPMAGRNITYHLRQAGRLVVSGTQAGSSFYFMDRTDGHRVVRLEVKWTAAHDYLGPRVAAFAASYSGGSELFQGANAQGPDVTSGAGDHVGQFFLPDADQTSIALVGDIQSGAALDFRRALKMRPDAQVVLLESNGGSVNEGLLVAHEIADAHLATMVPPNAGCYSACAYLFLAGKPRTVKGELGVHQISGQGLSASDAQVALSDVLDALAEFRVPEEVVSAMLRTKPDDIHILTPQELTALGSEPALQEQSASVTAATPQVASAPPPQVKDCPPIKLRPGAEALYFYGNGKLGNPSDLHYEAVIDKQSRNCVVSNGLIKLKMGVMGRLMLGPAGGETNVALPVRFAVVRESKPLFSELYQLPVTITPPARANDFVKVVEDVQIPYVSGDDVTIWVGFDAAYGKVR